jgi:hypothetical protein
VSAGPGTGELDLFIRGDISVADGGSLALGDRARPGALRVFVGGAIQGMPTLAGAQLYAPHAVVNVIGAVVDLSGSVFAAGINFVGPRPFHYDRSVWEADASCAAAAPQRCDGCYQCPDHLACTAGSCAACSSDAECCAPSACVKGVCQLPVSAAP